MKMVRVHITLWVVLLAAGFLLGFVPEYLKNRELRSQLETPQRTIDALTLQIRMAEVRDAAALMLVEVSRQNYGLARDHAADYYNKLKEVIAETQDENLKKSLTDLLATQESLSTSLAVPNANLLNIVQPIVLRTFEATKAAAGK